MRGLAYHRGQEALSGMNEQWQPRSSGVPTEDLLDEFDAANEEFLAGRAEFGRIADSVRAGKR